MLARKFGECINVNFEWNMFRIDRLLMMLFLLPTTLLAQKETLSSDEQVLKSAGYPIDTESLLNFFKKRTLSKEDHQTIAKLLTQLGVRSWKLREQASLSLAKDWGPAVIRPLEQATKSNDLEVVRRAKRSLEILKSGLGPELPNAAARILTQRDCPEAIPILVKYLPYADDQIVEDTLANCLGKLTKGKVHQALQLALTDPEASRRAVAGTILGKIKEKSIQQKVRKLLNDDKPRVRFLAAKGLVYGGDHSAVSTLIALLADESEEIIWSSEALLSRLAGEQSPAYPTEGKELQRAYQSAWQKWWKDNESKVDLAALTKKAPHRGWTLVTQMSQGQVWELDKNNRKRWTISGMAGPLDAKILNENRILVAEHSGKKVTERNRAGDILWEKQLSHGPVAVQRLPNGNTFIATYQAVMEVKRNGSTVYSHQPPGTNRQIYDGQRLANGRILLMTLNGTLMIIQGQSGKVLHSIATGLTGCYSARMLKNGRFLITSYSRGKVREIDRSGKVYWEYPLQHAYHAEELPNGNFLICSHGLHRIQEVNRAKQVVKEIDTGNNVWRAHRR